MQHFEALAESVKERLFHVRPEALDRAADPGLLAVALGATLYLPATRATLVRDIRKQARSGCISTVVCLEDSVPDNELDFAEDNLLQALKELDALDGCDGLPLIFIRCRTPEQLLSVGRRAGAALSVVYGFVLPKFENESGRGRAFLDTLNVLNEESGRTLEAGGQPLRAMPIIEAITTTQLETRARALADNLAVITEFRELVLSVRIGATDMSSAFGLRRSRDLTIYDVQAVASIIGDVVNIFGRPELGWVISGAVWEHFGTAERVLRPQLRSTPFEAANEVELRQRILMENLDGLIREIELDQANGLLGKTVIHPSHVPVVHSMMVVSHEEYLDALDIVGNPGGGAMASSYGNKMNESKPHGAWAVRTLLRARAFGVARQGVGFVELLEASMR
ncbi:HpcH/HpaI aldolase/citrate lyase family protein [Arthrobacter bambusae]|uniref:Citrate lyase beta subunit n=1 Tax=Arthrobacter bambusae TaxID=1338426 RepID=A0AAW8DCW6_9MICC|nr:HpcH/HpaI aldolase/citrate lyase family protein [Arthrobacter bambusae]MDP9905633.1 citrate lyase beta subunit [Arthrobacter bambusae]MDQ0127285.1 citrate lyase beta subunit [Arthrobacter bambusae]MDQ0178627.1 citrate lyase beta subunit [Arthrobacter bambusae]